MITGRQIMESAGILLQDEKAVRWTLPELARWINEGVRAILLAKPSANSGTRVLTLASGTYQSVASTAGTPEPLALLDVTRNIKSETPLQGGRTISAVSRAVMDAQSPLWHSERARKDVKHFMFTEKAPLEFYVWPPNDGTGKVEALISELPDALEASGDADAIGSYEQAIGLPDIYQGPLTDYVCYRTQTKDDLSSNVGRASVHYQQFANALGIKIQVEQRTTPNARRAE